MTPSLSTRTALLLFSAFVCSLVAPLSEYPAIAIVIVTAVGAPVTCRAQPRGGMLSPLGLAHLFFQIQLLFVPISMGVVGVELGTLPQLPHADAMNAAFLLQALVYWCFCIASRKHPTSSTARCNFAQPLKDRHIGMDSVAIGSAYAVIGGLGAYLFFSAHGGYWSYLSHATARFDATGLDGTVSGAASTFLRPFLGAAVVLLGTRLMLTSQNVVWRRLTTVSVVAVLILANAGYSRANLVVPLIAFAAMHRRHVHQVSRVSLLAAVAMTGTIAVAIGDYRASGTDVFSWWADLSIVALLRNSFSSGQIYAGGAQLSAFMLDATEFGDRLAGSTVVSSIMCPIPVVGASFRGASGAAIFNDYIYGGHVLDQVLPATAELFLNVHLVGVCALGVVTGRLVRYFDKRFAKSTDPFETFGTFTMGYWTGFLVIGSIAVLSQICVFMFWPFYAYIAVAQLRRRSRLLATKPLESVALLRIGRLPTETLRR